MKDDLVRIESEKKAAHKGPNGGILKLKRITAKSFQEVCLGYNSL